MQIGVGLPNTVAGVDADHLLAWARQADKGPCSTLAAVDRLAYLNFDAFTSLAVMAGATRRIRLMTSVLLAPLHNAGVLAKQAATLDSLCSGRLALGLGIGARPEDYEAAPASFSDRGQRFEQLVTTLRDVFHGRYGPEPAQSGGPPLILGGKSPKALQRAGRLGDGYISSVGTAAAADQANQQVRQAWDEAGRAGQPRLVAGFYFCIGHRERAIEHIRRYYAFMPQGTQALEEALVSTRDTILQRLESFAAVGIDEAIGWPCVAHLDQLHGFEDVAMRYGGEAPAQVDLGL